MKIAALSMLVTVCVGVAAIELIDIDTVDSRTVRAPVERVVIEAEEGDVQLQRRLGTVHVRVERHHTVNSPSSTQRVSGGVLTLRTTCPIGFVACDTDYRVGVPPGVDVEVRKASGRVDASALSAGVVNVTHDLSPVARETAVGMLEVTSR